MRDVSAAFSACLAAYFSRFLIFEAEGFRTVYLDVMRVYVQLAPVRRVNCKYRRTLVGLAFNSNDDCSYHSVLVVRYGIV